MNEPTDLAAMSVLQLCEEYRTFSDLRGTGPIQLAIIAELERRITPPAPPGDGEVWEGKLTDAIRRAVQHHYGYDGGTVAYDVTQSTEWAELAAILADRDAARRPTGGDDGEPVTPEWITDSIGVGNSAYARDLKRYELFNYGSVRVLFNACEGPLCWRPAIWVGGQKLPIESVTRGHVRRLLAALGLRLADPAPANNPKGTP